MALRSGYKGFKKLLPGLKIIRPGTLGIDNDILIPELNKTFFPRSEQAIVGAVNLMPGNIYELNTASAEVGDSTFTTYAGVQSFIAPIKRNTTYTLSRAAGNRFRVALSNSFPANGVDCKVLINADINKYTFNSGDYDYVFVMLNAGSETYDNIKPVLNVGSVVSSFVPYAMTNRELTEKVGNGYRPNVIYSDSLDDAPAGTVYASNTATSNPASVYGLCETFWVSPTTAIQRFISPACDLYIRFKSNTWGSWKKFTGTEVS